MLLILWAIMRLKGKEWSYTVYLQDHNNDHVRAPNFGVFFFCFQESIPFSLRLLACKMLNKSMGWASVCYDF